MGRYRKLPVEIEAIQWSGSNWHEILAFANFDHNGIFVTTENTEMTLNIVTLEGTMKAIPGDWVIRGVKGEMYPCKPDIFVATYEPVG